MTRPTTTRAKVAFTTAMLNIATQAADEWSGSYGMKISDAGRLLGVNN